MVFVEKALITVGTEVAKIIYQTKVKGWLRQGSLEEALVQRGARIAEGRKAQRQLDNIAEIISDKLTPLIEGELAGLPENERLAALRTVADVLAASNVSIELMLGADLDPSSLEAQVRSSTSEVVTNAGLSEQALALYGLVLQECCSYVIEIGAALPEFESRAFRELLERETETRQLIRELLSRLPELAGRSHATPDELFELAYRRAIARRLDKLELFGVDLAEPHRRYSLDVAYISLEAISESRRAGQSDSEDVGDLCDPNRQGDSDPASRLDDTERIEEVLRRAPRLVIKGQAGSGKTTLLQWVAVNCARQSHQGNLPILDEAVPFFIPLRRYANEALPAPEEFIKKVLPAVAGEAPDGWVHRQMHSGSAVVLIDGLDELPETQRAVTKEWIDDLCATFPHCRFVLTSRPAALDSDAIIPVGFDVVELQPMSIDDIRAFIDHWHLAAGAGPNQPDASQLARYREQLKDAIAASRSLQGLATTPLLCAMLCALHRERRTHLPRNRMQLYRTTLEALLDRRDTERRISPDVQIDLKEKELLLQDIAFWLALNDQSDAAKESVLRRIREKLASLPHLKASASQVYRHLLTRTGVLREPIVGRVDFVHRTFQEYLAAAEAINQDHIPLLIKNAPSDQWREIIILACGHASNHQRTTLVQGLLDAGIADPRRRHMFHLVAVSCLETAQELDPALNASLREALSRLVPPKSKTEAAALASAGALAIPYLSGLRGLATDIAATVRALGLIGTDAALESIKFYRNDTRITVQRELLRAWSHFDTESFAAEVISRMPFYNGRLVEISDQESLNALGQHVPQVRRLSLQFRGNEADLSPVMGFAKLSGLAIASTNVSDYGPVSFCADLIALDLHDAGDGSLESLRSLTKLRNLSISGAATTESLDFLPDSADLADLRISTFRNLRSLSGLERLSGLNYFTLRNVRQTVEISHLASCVDLKYASLASMEAPWLTIRARSLSLDGLAIQRTADLGSPRHLSVTSSNIPDLAESICEMSGLVELRLTRQNVVFGRSVNAAFRHIVIDNTPIDDLNFLPEGGAATDVWIVDSIGLRNITRLPHLPLLRSVVLIGCSEVQDLSPLYDLSDEVVIIIDQEIASAVEPRLLEGENVFVTSGRHSLIYGEMTDRTSNQLRVRVTSKVGSRGFIRLGIKADRR